MEGAAAVGTVPLALTISSDPPPQNSGTIASFTTPEEVADGGECLHALKPQP
jgi:hypothetical protein